MKNILKSVAILILFPFSGSVAADLFTNPLVPKAEATFARDYLQKLHERSFDHVKAYLDPALAAQVPDQKLEEVAQHFPGGKVISTELVGHKPTSLTLSGMETSPSSIGSKAAGPWPMLS